MALNNRDLAQIREYLLGKLTEDEQQRIEERLMVEDELFDELEVSKDELIEEYRAGGLAQNERQWFEQNFLSTPEGQDRHTFALAMDCLHRQRLDFEPACDPVPAAPAPAPQPPVSFLERLKSFVTVPQWAAAAAAALVLVVVVGVWIETRRPSQGQIFEATLANAIVVRGETSPQPRKLKLPPDTGKLKLQLQLPKPATPGARYKAQVDDRVNTTDVELIETAAGSVTVVVPAKLVPRGEYSLLLNVTHPDGTQQRLSYPFNVE